MIKIARHRATPSYAAGFARSAGESAWPGLWRDLRGAWVPALGNTGDSVFDVSGFGSTGTINNGSWSMTPRGPAVHLESATPGQWIDCGTIDLPGTQGKTFLTFGRWTVWMWGKEAGIRGWNGDVVGTRVETATVADGTGTPTFWARTGWSGGALATATSSIGADNQFHVVVGRMTAAQNEIWVDAVLEGTATGDTGALTGLPVTIGDPSNNLTGTGDYLAEYAWDRALTPTEIRHLYHDPLAPFRLRDRIVMVGEEAAAAGNPWWYYRLIVGMF